jgi:hypothetical protein
MLRVNVTAHALARWRERVAIYGDAPDSEVAEAVRNATPITADDPTPFPKVGGTRYFRHAGDPDIYFVTEPVARDFVNLITVLDCRPASLPPPKEEQVEHGKSHSGGTKLKKGVPRFPVPDYPEPRPDAPVDVRRDHWRALFYEAALACGRINRSHPDRGAWTRLQIEAQRKLSELRDEYYSWKRQRHDEYMEECGNEIYREDGTVNHVPAIKFLLAEVEALREEVAALKAAAVQQVA